MNSLLSKTNSVIYACINYITQLCNVTYISTELAFWTHFHGQRVGISFDFDSVVRILVAYPAISVYH